MTIVLVAVTMMLAVLHVRTGRLIVGALCAIALLVWALLAVITAAFEYAASTPQRPTTTSRGLLMAVGGLVAFAALLWWRRRVAARPAIN